MEKQHTGRISQTLIYIGKLFRMFVFQSDWKVLPMSAVIAAILAYVVSDTIFVTMEGTFTGSFGTPYVLVCYGAPRISGVHLYLPDSYNIVHTQHSKCKDARTQLCDWTGSA